MPIRRKKSAAPARPDDLVRLNKRMAELGLCSRREADIYIESGQVQVDGKLVSALGTKVSMGSHIELVQEALDEQADKLTILLHKPPGYVSGQPEHGHKSAMEILIGRNFDARHGEPPWGKGIPHKMWREGLAPAGRLDNDSTGLLVFTADGVVARTLINPWTKIEKEYLVTIDSVASPSDLDKLREGLFLDGKRLRLARVEREGSHRLRFTLKEGRKRQIRRMLKLLGIEVIALHRVRIGGVYLGALDRGSWRFLAAGESF